MQNLSELLDVDYVGLGQLAPRDTVIITVNNRLARRVIQSLARAQLDQAQRVSQTPSVVPWSGWLSQQLARAVFQEELTAHTLLLDSFATQTVWAEVIERLEDKRALIDVRQAAASAMQADQLIDEWDIAVSPSSVNEEYESFLRWRDAYRTRLHALDALDPNLAVTRLMQHIEAGLVLPHNIVLAGFTEISPRMGRLLDALLARGVELRILHEPALKPGRLTRLVCANTQTEWLAAAHWARAQLEAKPEGRFAIVAIALDSQAPFARRMLRRVLSNGRGEPEHTFNVAVARPLADWEAGRAALAWLRTFVLMKEQNGGAPAELSAALLAGHCIGHVAEMGARALIDARWRQNYLGHVNLATWTAALPQFEQISPAWLRS